VTVTSSPDAPTAHRRATIHPLRVSAVEPLTADAVAIAFEVPPELAADYRFVHGQHVSLRLRGGGRRRAPQLLRSAPPRGRTGCGSP